MTTGDVTTGDVTTGDVTTGDVTTGDVTTVAGTLTMPGAVHAQIVALAYDCYPEEACGLVAGVPGSDRIEHFYPCRNVAASARVYTIDPTDHLRAERDAEAHGWEIVGVVHSHTHTEPYPSPTDVAQAPDPAWQYLIVSLKRATPELRSYRIVDGQITDTPIALV